MNALGVRPSFATGFAQGAGESEYPELWRGLVGVWDSSLGQTGSRLIDWSGKGNILTAINGNSWVGGDISLIDQELSVRDDAHGALSFVGGDFTVVWSCKVTDIATENVALASQWGGLDDSREWRITYTQNTGVLDFRVNDGDNHTQTANTAMSVNIEDNRAIVFRKGTSLEFYKDGVLDNSPAFVFTPTLVTPGHAWVGGLGAGDFGEAEANAKFRGTIRFIYMYNRALIPAEISLLHQLRKQVA